LAVEPESSGERSELASIAVPRGRKGKEKATDSTAAAAGPSSDAIREGRVNVMVVHDNLPGKEQDLPSSPFPISSKDIEGGNGDHRIRRTPSKVSIPGTLHLDSAQNGEHDGEGGQPEEEEFVWGPSHPCYPHLNAHVPTTSPLYNTTRVIRIRRDWMQVGDLAPTFANLYPEVLDTLMSEQEFRRVVKHINDEVVAAFDPWGWRAWLDNIFGIATGWFWDDFGLTGVKGRLKRLEIWIDQWNRDIGAQDGVHIIPLRRTAYMTVSLPYPTSLSRRTNTAITA
jgi:hypothetical protein